MWHSLPCAFICSLCRPEPAIVVSAAGRTSSECADHVRRAAGKLRASVIASYLRMRLLISRRISPEMEMELDEGVRDRTFRIGAIRILAFDVLSTISPPPSPSRIADSFISESQSNN